MAQLRPMIALIGAKGGVGVTTLAIEIAGALPQPAALIETTGEDVLRHLVPETAELGELIRAGSRLGTYLTQYASRSILRVACDGLTAGLYATPEIARVVRSINALRFAVLDTGHAERVNMDVLAYSTHIWLVCVPDIRAIARAELFLANWPGLRGRITLVENFADLAVPALVPSHWHFPLIRLPRMAPNTVGIPQRSAFHSALHTALEAIFPVQPVAATNGNNGILRGFFDPRSGPRSDLRRTEAKR